MKFFEKSEQVQAAAVERQSSDVPVENAAQIEAEIVDAKNDGEFVELALAIPDYVPGTEEERKLVRKIDLFLLPCIFIMYFLSYMDRINVGNARVAGLQEDLHLSSGQYSIVLIVMIIFYVAGEIPLNMILSKSRPSVFLPTLMMLWGVLTCLISLVKTYHQLVGIRILVGILEAGFAPGVLLMFSSWYKRDEQALRFGIYISAPVIAGAFGGVIAGAVISSLEGKHGIRGWRWLFIVEGAVTVFWSCCAFFLLLDFPAKTRYLSEREQLLAVARLQNDSIAHPVDGVAEITHTEALKQALLNWRTWLCTLGYAIITGTSSLSYFYPTIVQSLGYKGSKIQYMTVPIYAVAFVCNLSTSYAGDRKFRPYRAYVTAVWMVVLTASSLIITVCYNPRVRYAFLVFMTSAVWATTAATLAISSTTFSYMEHESRAISLATVNSLGTSATIYGAFLFPSKDSPKYIMGFSVITSLSFLGIFVFVALQILNKRYPGKPLKRHD
ncbi:MFS general substrate transporter [Lipomyces arxii]|uniref:MFS general substrate transporter n=1 Tax=Lipomyces arxii TaxID=56418 RepID=UPI0034CFC647